MRSKGHSGPGLVEEWKSLLSKPGRFRRLCLIDSNSLERGPGRPLKQALYLAIESRPRSLSYYPIGRELVWGGILKRLVVFLILLVLFTLLVTLLMVFAGGSVSSATPAPSVDRGALFWNSTKDSNDVDMFQEYPRQHPNGGFAGLARLKIKKLKAERQLAVAAPPKQAAPKAAVGVYPQGFKPGASFKDCPECPEMVVIPAGSFRMRGVSGGGGGDEKPVHTVRVPKPFAAGKFEVTRGEFAAFVNATGHGSGDGCYVYNGSEWSQDGSKNWRDPGYSQTGRDPVACVNWDDIQAYIDWLSRQTGKRYRLLSEAEWEYAARAGTSTKYSFGNSEGGLCVYGNGADQSTNFNWRNKSCNDGYGNRTAPAGSFKANRFGLHDMHGNVWEWVDDCNNESYDGAPTNGGVWSSGDCSPRVLRGGSWYSKPEYMRSAARYGGHFTGGRINFVGFRVARTFF